MRRCPPRRRTPAARRRPLASRHRRRRSPHPSRRCAGLLLSTKILTGQMINDLVKPAVEKCTGDDDMDVAHFAAVATERMQGALMG